MSDMETETPNDCEARNPQNPCDLCKARAVWFGTFIAVEDGTYVCDDCIPIDEGIADRVNAEPEPDPSLEVWEEGSDGWMPGTVITCRFCNRNIDIVDNAGTEEEES